MTDELHATVSAEAVQLGRLSSVPVRDVWPREPSDFTPWLARDENLTLLAQILNLGPLVVDGTEVAVGDFYIDILAKDGNGGVVIIENQFGRTDHSHLGQIMTYVAGQDGPVSVVWIAEKFREEHRAAVDWLNANTIENRNFFAAELEVLRIGNSLPAPWFNLVAKPNNWSRNVKQATQAASDTPANEVQAFNISYWQAFAEYLQEKNSKFRFHLPNKWRYAYMVLATGLLYMNAWNRAELPAGRAGLTVDIWIGGNNPKKIFRELIEKRTQIELEFGESLQWEEQPEKKGSRILITEGKFNCGDKSTWPLQFDWFLRHMEKLRDVFVDRVKEVDKGLAE